MSASPDVLADFDTFWRAYPRHEAKRDAEKAWRQLDPDAELVARIVAHVQTRPWPRDKKYIMLPATFLRGYRWEDETPSDGSPAPDTPANRWQPSDRTSRLIKGGMGIECPPEHGPVCATDLDCLRKRANDAGAGL